MNTILTKSPGLVCSSLFLDVLMCCFICLALKFSYKLITTMQENRQLISLISSPKCPSWLSGHLSVFPPSEFGLRNRVAAMEQFPAMYCSKYGPMLMAITIHHPELIKIVLNSDAHKGFLLKKALKNSLGEGLLSSDGKVWQKKRHMLTPAFRFEALKSHIDTFNDTSKLMLQWLEQESHTNKSSDIYLPCSCLSFDNMTRCIMSQPGVKNGEDVPFIRDMKDLQHLMISRFRNPLLRSSLLYKLTSNGKKFQLLASNVTKAITKIVNDRKNVLSEQINEIDTKANSSKYKSNRYIDFLDILLKSKYDDGSGLSEAEIHSEVRLFFVAGSETTGNAMTWLAYSLAYNQDWQEKCREEIIEICGDNDDIKWEHISKLRNLSLCIKESLRLYPIASYLGRTVQSPIRFVNPYDREKAVTLKKGTNVQLCIFALHRHPDFWKNPEKFDPERFTPERSAGRHSYAYIPFSASYRNCIGQQFAMNEIKVSFAHILRKFRLLPAPDSPLPEMVPEITLKPKDCVYVKIEKV